MMIIVIMIILMIIIIIIVIVCGVLRRFASVRNRLWGCVYMIIIITIIIITIIHTSMYLDMGFETLDLTYRESKS